LMDVMKWEEKMMSRAATPIRPAMVVIASDIIRKKFSHVRSRRHLLAADTNTIIMPIYAPERWLLGRVDIENDGYTITIIDSHKTVFLPTIKRAIVASMNFVGGVAQRHLRYKNTKTIIRPHGCGILTILNAISIGKFRKNLSENRTKEAVNQIPALRRLAATWFAKNFDSPIEEVETARWFAENFTDGERNGDYEEEVISDKNNEEESSKDDIDWEG